MGTLVFQATLGGQVNLTGPNTASTFTISVPAVTGTMITSGDTATVTSTMISGPVTTAKGGTGLTSFTANGVVYASSSSALATGSALTFHGTNFATTASNFDLNPASGAPNISLREGNTYRAYLEGNSSGLVFGIGASATEQMRLTSTGLGIGTSSPAAKLDVFQSSVGTYFLGGGGDNKVRQLAIKSSTTTNSGDTHIFDAQSGSGVLAFAITGSEKMRLDNSGNLGLGVTPSAWSSGKAIEVGNYGNAFWNNGASENHLTTNAYYNSGWKFGGTGYAQKLTTASGQYQFNVSTASGTAGNAITFTQAMTLDASGNLLVGTTSNNGLTAGVTVKNFFCVGTGNNIPSGGIALIGNAVAFYSVTTADWQGANSSASAMRVGLSGLRSINAAGTVNAGGTDYAEYMTKSGDFTVAKGDVVGVDAQGKLTNVFADAVTFMVKSTNPSFVGGDSWGVGFENDAEGLEDARQTVDRIAFAGQVPVNVLGATAGQYIIPVNDNGTIKGQAVNNPTFEQYQSSVGKVIAIETDGRARIIVKVA